MSQRVTRFRFLDDLILRRRIKGDGHLFITDNEYRVTFSLNGRSEFVYVPAGMETDLASIPIIVPRWIAQKIDKSLEAAIVHDWLYHAKGDGRFSREDCDHVFYGAMIASDVPQWRAFAMFQAVRKFGWGPWDDDD